MMESYFVRTLGMHRVYNSAFMNFLKMEENAKFRLSLKNVLEFNPEILKRYVNFMNNPDEETAVAQFGSGDKYFGACTLMAALPGLPMFGHGQIEGFTEKYGMEYRKAYLDEQVDEELVRRHERQIFPLLRKRALFSGVKDFLLYDFFLRQRRGGRERDRLLQPPRRTSAAWWWSTTASPPPRAGSGSRPPLPPRTPPAARSPWCRRTSAPGWGCVPKPGKFVVFRDLVTGLAYIRASGELCASGLFLELAAYQSHVFLDFRERVDDADGRLFRLAAYLGGRGCASLEIAEREMALQPLHEALRDLCRPERMERLATLFLEPPGSGEEKELGQDLEGTIGDLGRPGRRAARRGSPPGSDRRRHCWTTCCSCAGCSSPARAPRTGPKAGEGTPEDT